MSSRNKLSCEPQLLFESFERVVYDRAITGAIHKLPHAAGDRAGATDHVRKALAGFRARVVDCAHRAVEKHAALLFRAAQYSALIRGLHGIVFEESGGFDPQVARQPFNVAVRDNGSRYF